METMKVIARARVFFVAFAPPFPPIECIEAIVMAVAVAVGNISFNSRATWTMKNFRTLVGQQPQFKDQVSKCGNLTRSSKEQSIVCRDDGEGKKTGEIRDGVLEEFQLIQGRDGRNEDTTETTSSCSSCLDNRVLLGSERTTKEWEVRAEGLAEESKDGKPEDGTEQIGTKSPTSFKTYVCTIRIYVLFGIWFFLSGRRTKINIRGID